MRVDLFGHRFSKYLTAQATYMRPARFVMPIDPGGRAAWQLRIGFWLYDWLARGGTLPPAQEIDQGRPALGVRQQRTLRTAATLEGPGLLSGRHVRLRFKPAPANTGHVFIRVDLPAER